MTMDIFEQDAFKEVEVLERINTRDAKDLFLESALNPTVVRCFTSEFAVEMSGGEVRVLPYSPRGAPLPQNVLGKRRVTKLPIPRFGEGFTVNYEEARDVSRIAMVDGQQEAATALVDRHLESVNDNFDATKERQLTHAVRGYITDIDDTVEVDLYAALGADQKVYPIYLNDSTRPWIRQLQGAKSLIDDALGMDKATSYLLLTGSAIAAWMENDPTYVAATTSETAVRLSQADTRKGVRINTDVSVLPGRRGYFDADEAYLVPVVAGFFKRVLGPSDSSTYEGQVLERYVTSEELEHGRGWEYEVTAFMLTYARKPGAIIRLDFQDVPEPLAGQA